MSETFFQPAELLEPPLARAAYSDRTSWIMAQMSVLAYEPFEKGDAGLAELKKKLAVGGFELAKPFNKVTDHRSTQAILVRKPGHMTILAFRGTTANFKHILTDLEATWFTTPNGRAHKGFIDAYKAIEGDLHDNIKLIPKDEPFYVTGHSLGGALATVAAMRLEDKCALAACYTFGSPRVGNPEWSEKVKAPVYRVVNAADGVPLVPFSLIAGVFLFWLSKVGFVGFQHVGDLRYLPAGEPEMYKTGGAAALRRGLRITLAVIKLFALFQFKSVKALVTDHKSMNYVEKLKSIAEKQQ